MAKKMDFDNTIKKVEGISNKVDIIMRNRLIIAIFLIVDGFTFILNPGTTLSGMAQNIMLMVILAAASVLITNLAAKPRDARTIAIAAAVVVVAIVMYFYPDFVAAYMQLLLSLFIICDGASNIISILHLNNKLSKYTESITKKYNQLTSHKKKADKDKKVDKAKFKEIDDSINTSLEEQKEKLITPLKKIVNRSSKSSILYIITNAASVVFGIVLLVYPDASMMLWGMIFLYTGFSNLFISIRTMGLAKKIKEKKFKEILFDAEQNGKKKQKARKH